MDRSTITRAIADLDTELALLAKRRQLLEEVLGTFGGDEAAPPAPAVAPKLAAIPPVAKQQQSKPRPFPKAKAAPRKWDWLEVGNVIDEALAAGKNPRLVLIQRYEVTDAMSYYLMKQVKSQRNPATLPKPPVDTGRFSTDDALAALEEVAAG